MGRHRDAKIELIAGTALGQGASDELLHLLGRLVEHVEGADGTVLHRADRDEPWTWFVVSGTVAVDSGSGPALAGPGAWIASDVASAVCLGETTLLCLGRRELVSLQRSLARSWPDRLATPQTGTVRATTRQLPMSPDAVASSRDQPSRNTPSVSSETDPKGSTLVS